MGTALRRPGQIVPMLTTSLVRDGDVVRVTGADYTVAFPSGTAQVTPLCGVVMRPDGSVAASGDTVDVVVSGIYPVRAGDTITRGTMVTSYSTDGTATTEAATAGVNVGCVGQALASGVAGDLVAVLINPSIKQGG